MEDFFNRELLETDYYKMLKQAYEYSSNLTFPKPHRSPEILLDNIHSIHQYNQTHARSYTKRLIDQQKDFKSCEAVFTEVIVYSYYLRLVYEGIIKSLSLSKSDYDLKIEMKGGVSNFLEIFSIMPNINVWTVDEIERGEAKATEIRTHLQDSFASIRYKLLEKINKQKQMSQPRRNFAVIELNNPIIADDFAILSSLSDGYKITIDTKNMRKIGEGYDWSKSVFDEPSLENLFGIIYFKMGDYNHRKYILNPNYNSVKNA
jgi:hypothetical protein